MHFHQFVRIVYIVLKEKLLRKIIFIDGYRVNYKGKTDAEHMPQCCYSIVNDL